MTAELATEQRRTGFVLPADADIMRITQAEIDANEEFYEVPGFGLVTDKSTMIGLPFTIIGVTFQQPVADKANEWGERDYVTLRAIVTDEAGVKDALNRGLIPSGVASFEPGERIVINDGSTGIRRQVVKMLDDFGLINVGADKNYDKPWTQWEQQEFDQFENQGDVIVPSISRNHNGNLFMIKVRRGLRASAYTNEYGDSVTYYL